jgi:scyllo-inositol 2-dehydrogenase (NADP+)
VNIRRASHSPAAAGAEVRVGLIGYGLAGAAFHAPLIAAAPRLRLSAVVTGNPERGARARREHPGIQVFGVAERLWESRTIDLVVVATPNRSHVPLALAALDAGLAVVVDKPLAQDVAQARRLIAEAERRRLLLTVFQNRRWDGDFLTLRKLLANGALGRVVRFESRFERWRPLLRGGWRESGDPAEAGGLLYDLGSHLVDQALLLFGPVGHVYAELARHRSGAQVDDDSFVALTHESGVRSHLWMSVVAGQPGPRLRVLGTQGTFTKHGLDVQEAALRAGERPGGRGWGEEPETRWGVLEAGDETRRVATEPGAYPRFYAGVAASLLDGAAPPVDPHDAVAALRVIECAFQSAAENRVVPLAE